MYRLGHGEGEVEQRDVEGTGDGGDHLARRLLAPTLDLREVLGGDPRSGGRVVEGVATLVASSPELLAQGIAPQWLGCSSSSLEQRPLEGGRLAVGGLG